MMRAATPIVAMITSMEPAIATGKDQVGALRVGAGLLEAMKGDGTLRQLLDVDGMAATCSPALG